MNVVNAGFAGMKTNKNPALSGKFFSGNRLSR